MNDNNNPGLGGYYSPRGSAYPLENPGMDANPGPTPQGNGGRAGAEEVKAGGIAPWPFIELFLKRWYWMFLCGLLLAAAGIFAGQSLWEPGYTASVKLLRTDSHNTTEFFKPREFSEQTYGSLLRAPELLRRVASKAKPPLIPEALNHSLLVTPMRDSEVIMAVLPGETAQAAVDLANLYANEAVAFTKEMQASEASRVNNVLKQQLAQMDADVQSVNENLRSIPRSALMQAGPRSSTILERLQLANEELATLLSKYTDRHPAVQEHRAKIAVLQKQLNDPTAQPMISLPSPGGGTLTPSMQPTNSPTGRPGLNGRGTAPGTDFQADMLLSQLQVLAAARLTLATRQREAQLFADEPPGYCQLMAAATPAEVITDSPKPKIAFLGVLGFAFGFVGCLFLVMFVEIMDDRLKNADDLKRVSRLPVLATLGNLERMSHQEQSRWAFRTWTALQSRLSLSPNHGLVCGLTSSTDGEGRSTWIGLLAQAASECGFRVLTIATDELTATENADAERISPLLAGPSVDDATPAGLLSSGDAENSTALTVSVLSSPAMVTQKLTGKDPQPYVHIPLPGWVWSLDRRKQWQTALAQWSKIDNIVILVELPSASAPESVLLAENLPNLLWLSHSKRAKAGMTRQHLQTLREARCNLVGAVLNHESSPGLKNRFARWMNGWFILAGAILLPSVAASAAVGEAFSPAAPIPAFQVSAQVTNEPPVAPSTEVVDVPRTNRVSFSVISPDQKAPWQQRLTLGPGDSLNLSIYGQPELVRTEVMIGPDGRLSFLQADIPAAGLTVDELRGKLDEELGKFYRTPRTIVTPVAFRSKKYYVLGKVASRGVYVLDQPITLLEAVARAHGLETGLVDNQNTVELADLQRSFLVRQGKRVQIDFEKLFQEGDLSHNIPIEPGDYLYFAPVNLREVYVFGEVNSPGPVTYMANTTVVGAISARAGFTDKAYKGRVLVIRGSLNRPRTFIIDVWGNLEARSVGFKLEPKDIIYVSRRPFTRVEEVLDLAATAFIESAFSTYALDKVGPLIKSPILP